MRQHYLKGIKNKFHGGDILWLFKGVRKYAGIHASKALSFPFTGPALGTFITTYRCNAKCSMCHLPERAEAYHGRGKNELKIREQLRLLDQMASLSVLGVGFTGGEPLLRKDIFTLLSHSSHLGMITHLNTNGALIDENITEELLKAGVHSINISIDGANPASHDRLRGDEGSFIKAIGALKVLSRSFRKIGENIKLNVVTVIGKDNIKEVKQIVELIQEIEGATIGFLPIHDFQSQLNQPSGYVGKETSLARQSNDLIGMLLDMKEKGYRIESSLPFIRLFENCFAGKPNPLTCYADYNSIVVDCYGDIYPCVPFSEIGKPAANIKEGTLKEIWRSKKYAETRKEISKCKACYWNCHTELNLLFNPISFIHT